MAPTKNQRSVPIALIAIAVLLLAARAGAYFLRAKDHVQWVAIDDAVPIAQSTGKPILFYFPASDRTTPEVFADEAIAKDVNARFVPVRVTDDGQKAQLLMRNFNVRVPPAVIFTDALGNELGRMEGFRAPEEFRRVMEGVR